MENDSLFRQDPELYDMSVETRQAMTYGKTDDEIGMPDVDAEWDALSARTRQRSSRRAVLRIAAVFAGLVMMTGLAWATVALVRQHDEPVEQTAKPAQQQPATKSAKAKRKTFITVRPTKNASVIFKNVTLESILSYVAEAYNCRVEYRNDEARHVRLYFQWDADDGIETFVDKVNHFEKVHLSYDAESKLLTVE